MGNSGKSLYHQLLAKGTKDSSPSSSSSGGNYGFRGSRGRFSGSTKKPPKQKGTPEPRDRGPAVPVVRDGRVQKVDEVDRELAYRPPAPSQQQVVSWSPPTFWDILSDLGLRVVEVGIASIAQEIAYFFTRRRFMPTHLRRGLTG
jgi:hypothetical protein